MKIYYLMAILNGDKDSLRILLEYYINTINYCINNNNIIDNNIINDAIEIAYQFKKYEHEFMFIKILFKYKCIIRNYYVLTNYNYVYNLQLVMAKYIHKCCSHKNIFKNFNKILLFLNICKGINIPKYIKLDIIYSIAN